LTLIAARCERSDWTMPELAAAAASAPPAPLSRPLFSAAVERAAASC